MVARRGLLIGAGALFAAGLGLAGWSLAWEPGLRLAVVRHAVASPAWPAGLPPITIACVADPHCCWPHTPPERLDRIVRLVGDLRPDMVVVLGDYLASHRFVTRRVEMGQVAEILAGLAAPLGVHAILGNHDWWEDGVASAAPGQGMPAAAADFAAAGMPVLHNAARAVTHAGRRLWVAGLGSQWAYRGLVGRAGADDLEAALRAVPPADPVLLLAHEPDIFPRVPSRVALTLAGHTHGGQVSLAGWRPYVPSRFGDRYAWGHVEEAGRHLVVSGGIGQSILPVRLGVPPEITLVTLSAAG